MSLGELQPDGGYSVMGLWHLNGNANDASGKGNNGSVSGAIAINTGKFGGAYSFDGTDDYISIPHSISLNITGDITIALWIKVDDVKSLSDEVPDVLTKGDYNEAYSVWAGNWDLEKDGYTFAINNNQVVSNTDASGGWDFLVCVKSGTSGLIYLNGRLDGSGTVPSTIRTTSTALTISSSSYPFAGDIDEVAIWNRALSAAEIRALYAYAQPSIRIL